MVETKIIRYGTALMPTVAKGIIGTFPGGAVLSPTSSIYCQFGKIGFEGIGRSDVASVPTTSKFRYPSISVILGCTQSYKQLWWWQLRMIKQLGGLAQLRQYMRQRVTLGTRFHAKMKSLLLLHANKKLMDKTLDELCYKLDEPMANYVKSALPLLRSFDETDQIRFEEYVTHPQLYYYGRFDAIVRYKDVFFVVDFKTTTIGSLKDGNDLNQLYAGPVQVAAYVGAVNSASAYACLSTIKRAAVVIVKEDGSEADFVEMDSQKLKEFWEKWIFRVQQFWYEVENRPLTRGAVSFVYDGKEQQQSSS